ncbi:hypothetical protein BJX61DRAFT_513620 [Aspergillus egyptiacus]|nr:hypothetical protein BJX61DRAFT_513620 [Aspergillus egyptiacus]
MRESSFADPMIKHLRVLSAFLSLCSSAIRTDRLGKSGSDRGDGLSSGRIRDLHEVLSGSDGRDLTRESASRRIPASQKEAG